MPVSYMISSTFKPSFNLALEECVLKSWPADGNACLYFWRNSPAVIIGKNQDAWSECNIECLRSNNIPLVRRISGGGAVYHDSGVLNISHIGPAGDSGRLFGGFPEELASIFKTFHCGARLGGRNDLMVKDRKIAGFASYLYKNMLLCHCSILVHARLEMLETLLHYPVNKYAGRGIKSVRSRVANLRDFSEATQEEIINSIIKKYEARNTEPEIALLGKAALLAKDRYENNGWNYGGLKEHAITYKRHFAWGEIIVNIFMAGAKSAGIKIEGDFFALEPVENLENMISDCVREKRDLAECLERVDMGKYFYGCENRELTEFFSEILNQAAIQ